MTLVALLAAACVGGSPSQPALQSSPPPTPTAVATASASADASDAPASALEGTWATTKTTCEQQNAALTKAGFSAEDLELGGWDPATCGSMMHGSQFRVRFAGERLVSFNDDTIGWDGIFRVVDDDTLEAGDSAAGLYITYQYGIDGDGLTLDMVRDDYPTSSPAELAGEQIAQTVIYETAPFARVP